LSAQAIIKQAADFGVSVSLNGDSLALKAATKPSASLLAKLKQHKAEIVAALRLEGGIAPPEPDEAEIEERKGMAMGGVPAAYADAWARLQCQKPRGVTDEDWRLAVEPRQPAAWCSNSKAHRHGLSGLGMPRRPAVASLSAANGRTHAAPIFPCELVVELE
jgi:hypothetical protein